jgi:hypothetical protein
MAEHGYKVLARPSMPPFAAEQRYVTMETELAEREMARLPARSWLPFSYPELGLLRRTDWRHYIRSLENYARDLDRLEGEIREGLVPLSFSVTNESAHADADIRVHIMLQHGAIHASKKPPTRPKRVDGAINKAGATRFRGFEGFVRKRIHIGRHGLEAEFSSLQAHDSALVVNHALYVDMGHGSTLRYEIHSRRLPHGQAGEISFHSQE